MISVSLLAFWERIRFQTYLADMERKFSLIPTSILLLRMVSCLMIGHTKQRVVAAATKRIYDSVQRIYNLRREYIVSSESNASQSTVHVLPVGNPFGSSCTLAAG